MWSIHWSRHFKSWIILDSKGESFGSVTDFDYAQQIVIDNNNKAPYVVHRNSEVVD